MKKEYYQNIVLGAGSAGLTVAIGLANLGKQTVVVEAKHVGGDCTNVGCVPSKTLIHLADRFHPGENREALMAEVTRKRNALRDKETEEVKKVKNLTLISGNARFTDQKQLSITEPDGEVRLISGSTITIATGARPRLLDISGLPPERLLTNESLFDIVSPPDHMAIIGAGIIAVELAFAFKKLGTKITMIALDPQVLPTYPSAVSEAIQPELDKHQITTYYNATSDSYDAAANTLYILQKENILPIERVDTVLLAIGRIRNIDDLGLENAGIVYDRGGIQTDSFGRTNVSGVFAAGDVTKTSAFTHSANAQGRRIVQKIAFPWLPSKMREPLFPTATFSDPEIATIGLNRNQIGSKYHPESVMNLRVEFRDLDRGYTDDVENGFIMVDCLRLTGQILGVTIVGPRASEMISFFTLAINQHISLYKIYNLVYPYPTFSNAIQKIADIFMRETLPNLPREAARYLRYGLLRIPNES